MRIAKARSIIGSVAWPKSFEVWVSMLVVAMEY